jgi:hypothetical protein
MLRRAVVGNHRVELDRVSADDLEVERGISDNEGAVVDDFVRTVVDLLTIPIEGAKRGELREELRMLPWNCSFARIFTFGTIDTKPRRVTDRAVRSLFPSA